MVGTAVVTGNEGAGSAPGGACMGAVGGGVSADAGDGAEERVADAGAFEEVGDGAVDTADAGEDEYAGDGGEEKGSDEGSAVRVSPDDCSSARAEGRRGMNHRTPAAPAPRTRRAIQRLLHQAPETSRPRVPATR